MTTWHDDLRNAHDGWVQRHADNLGDRFEPRKEGSDYNLHVLDIEANAAEEADFEGNFEPILANLPKRA